MNEPIPHMVENHEHYPHVTHTLIRLFNEGILSNVIDVNVEPEFGYAAQINYKSGSHRISYGNDPGLNSGASCDLARDKGHTKYILRSLGITCPNGEEFLLPWWADEIKTHKKQYDSVAMKTTDTAETYVAEQTGYPVYVKPVDGSKGATYL